jgi:hypothetical protein
MIPDTKSGLIIGCSVLRDEVEALRLRYWPEWNSRYLSSLLHMRPSVLADELDGLIHHELERGNQIVLVYGDCCQSMEAFDELPGVARTPGMNCCELILGKRTYKPLIAEGVFFLFPEWTRRWQEIFRDELGLNQENAEDLMHEMHSRLIYLDTGVVPVPADEIAACSRFCGLPYEIRQVSLDHLNSLIQSTMDRIHLGDART